MSLFFLLVTGGLNAQNATLTGNVFQTENGKQVPVYGAQVLFLNPDSTVFRGARTDFDGNFKIVGVPGKTILGVRANGLEKYYQDIDLVAGANDAIVIELFIPSTVIGVMQVVGVKKASPISVAASDNNRKNEKKIMEGLPAETMKSNGDATAAAAVQRIPGVTIVDGKYVFVRGLGDRYTKTIMNSIEIPGLDPDRNSVQLDIFPTALIDNISVYKTFTPDLAGDFTGGLVDVTTKDAPSKQTMVISGNLGYNSVTTFNKNFQTYQGGKLDYLGIDDGTRALPFSPTAKIPDPALKDPATYNYTKQFTPTMGGQAATALPNHVYSISYGNSKRNFLNKGITYGYVVAYNYRNSNSFRDVEFGNYMKNQDASQTQLETFRVSNGSVSENEVLWTGVYNNSFLFKSGFKLNANIFHTQNGSKSASYIRENNVEGNQAVLIKQGLQYSQRRITNLDLTGTHKFTKWNLRWDVAPTIANISDPDLRSTVLEEVANVDNNGDTTFTYELNPATGSQIRRIFRNLDEKSINTKVSFSRDLFNSDSTLQSKFSFGAANVMKRRNFSVYDYFFELQNSNQTSLNPDDFFAPENLWTPETNSGLYAKGQREPANQYTGTQIVSGAYVMHEKTFSKRFDLTYGLRAEQAYNFYTGQNNNGTQVYDNEKVLDEFVLLPAASMRYILSPLDSAYQSNLRFAFSKTVARPSFREKSIAQVFDPILGRTFNGNILLAQTDIYNFDVRWEKFFGRTELISASAFYKRFYNPIEIATYEQAPNEVLPVNAGQADVYGLEFELRKAIGFNKKEKEHLSFVAGTNLNYIVSQIDMTKVLVNKGDTVISEYDNRVANARGDENISRFRPMYGQSPFSINSFVNFKNDSLGLVLNLSYNVQGPRLAVIGVGLIPDVYERQFNSLNFKGSKTFGATEQWSVSLTVRNILNNTRIQYYQGNNGQRETYYSFKPGVNATASVSLRLDQFKKKKQAEVEQAQAQEEKN